jgi:hypothetical protein
VTIFCVVGDPDIIQRYAPIVFWTRGDGGLNGTVQFDLFCDFEEWSSDFTFTANPAGNALACPAHNARAIPIPYEAARGGWKGQAMGRNIASFKDLQEQLGDILNTVKASPRMTFRPGAPVGGAPNRPYLWQRLPTQYYGLFPKKEAMLGDVTNLPG